MGDISYRNVDVSGYAGSDVFDGLASNDANGTQDVVQVFDVGAAYTLSSLIDGDSLVSDYNDRLSLGVSEPTYSDERHNTDGNAPKSIYHEYVGIVEISDANTIYNIPMQDYIYPASVSAQGSSKNIVSASNPRPLAYDPVLISSPVALAPPSPSKSALRPSGCSRCAGQVAQASYGQGRPFAAILAPNLFQKVRSNRGQHTTSGTVRERESRLAAAWTPPRGWWKLSL